MWSKHPRAQDRLASLTHGRVSSNPDGNGFQAPDAQRGGHRLLDAAPSALSDEPDTESNAVRWFTRWDPRARKAAMLVLAGLALVVVWWWWSGQPEQVRVVGASSEQADVSVTGGVEAGAEAGVDLREVSTLVLVHVVGKVANPGVVELPHGSRVQDAIEAAGGATKVKALESVNLARPVVDGEQIVVGASADGGSATISINAADADELDELPGVGPVIAERIVQWRETNGPFSSIDELTEVSGIGPSMIEQIRDLASM